MQRIVETGLVDRILKRNVSENAKKERGKYSLSFFIIDLILAVVSFYIMNYIRRGSFTLEPHYYVKLFILFCITWITILLLSKKYALASYPSLKSTFLLIAKTITYQVYLLALIVVFMGLYALSRKQILGSCLILFFLEIICYSSYYALIGKKLSDIHFSDSYLKIKVKNFSLYLLFNDFIILVTSFFLINFFKRGTFRLQDNYDGVLLIISALWMISAFFTRKFNKQKYRNYYYAFAPYIKSFILMTAAMALIVFTFRLFHYSRFQVFGTLGLMVILEAVFYYIYFISGRDRIEKRDVETIDEIRAILRQEELPMEVDLQFKRDHHIINPVVNKLKEKYLSENPDLYKFIYDNLKIDAIDISDTIVINTHTLYNIQTIDDQRITLLINLHRLNDFRWLNRYFLEVHRKIYNGGCFIGCADTIATYRKKIFKKYPKIIAQPLYIFNFIINRIIPKLPGIKKLYFFITKGRNRDLSRAEILGRLYFCGFKVIAEKVIADRYYYIVQRVKNPSIDTNPSYGPTIKLRRIGLDGEMMYINKFRTMHPYSEYLQNYIYEENRLNANGKFSNDFRITEWGRFMRKLWIDELPQVVNFLRGDLSLVGVRALSEHYYSLYPQDVKQLRSKFKPGLVPPYYADMPKSFDEIIASERNYFLQKQKHPFITDIKYFFKASYNIIFRHARSQ
jgi:lipopolysaccharide/colanic/teichoic acid biosynthesis glycosyltransferase